MSINFKCPHCQSSLQAMDNLAGKQGNCPKCNKEITVPQETGTQSEEETAKKE